MKCRNVVVLILKLSTLVFALISIFIALFLLCGIPRRYSVPELLSNGSVNPLYNVHRLIENVQITLMNEDKANVALIVAVVLLGCHILILYFEKWASQP